MTFNNFHSRLLIWAISMTLGPVFVRAQTVEVWEPAGDLNVARRSHRATRLNNGQVLMTGGYNDKSARTLNSVEIFMPETGRWVMAPPMQTTREFHTATLLPTGKVLVTGGYQSSVVRLASAEMFDPEVGRLGGWTSVPDMLHARSYHTATLLRDGRVLVVGDAEEPEIFDPSAETVWSLAGSPSVARRVYPSATLLHDGRVLFIGGADGDTPEIFDPNNGSWTSTPQMSVNRASGHTASLLHDGRVLVVGGYTTLYVGGDILECELFDPRTGKWERASGLSSSVTPHSATVLSTGEVLIASSSIQSSQVYDPVEDRWRSSAKLPPGFYPFNQADVWSHSVSLLPDGRVLIAGAAEIRTYTMSFAQLIYPQLVLGGGFEMVLFATNQGPEAWGGQALFNGGDWPSDGRWSLNGDDYTGTSGFAFALEPNETRRFRISSTSATAHPGWLEIGSDRPLQDLATSYFYNFYARSGELLDSTGVVPAPGGKRLRFAVEKSASVNTGIAIRRSSGLILRLFDNRGNLVEKVERTLEAPLFFDQVFTGVPGDFVGSIDIESPQEIHLVVLRQEIVSQSPLRFQLTSIPATPVPQRPPEGGSILGIAPVGARSHDSR